MCLPSVIQEFCHIVRVPATLIQRWAAQKPVPFEWPYLDRPLPTTVTTLI